MTTKFSRSAYRQTEPAICRSIPPEWIPPDINPYPEICGFVDFKRTRYDATICTDSLLVKLPWLPAGPYWHLLHYGSGYFLHIVITYLGPGSPPYIATSLQVAGAEILSGAWYGPPYTPLQHWESGPETLHGPPPADYLWQTFTTAAL